jgi:hypothetical protein
VYLFNTLGHPGDRAEVISAFGLESPLQRQLGP